MVSLSLLKMPSHPSRRSILKKGGGKGHGGRRVWGQKEHWPRKTTGSNSVLLSGDSDGTDLCRLVANMMLDKCRRKGKLRVITQKPPRNLIKHLQTHVAIDKRIHWLKKYWEKLVNLFDIDAHTERILRELNRVDLHGRRFRILLFKENANECQIIECLVRTIDCGVIYENLVPAFRKEGEEYMPVRAPVDFHDRELYCDFSKATGIEKELMKKIYVCEMLLREL